MTRARPTRRWLPQHRADGLAERGRLRQKVAAAVQVWCLDGRGQLSGCCQGVGSVKVPLKMSRFPKSGGQSVNGEGATMGDPSIKDCR